MVSIIVKHKRRMIQKYPTKRKSKSCLNREIIINHEKLYCKNIYKKLAVINITKKEYALSHLPANTTFQYIKANLDSMHFSSIDSIEKNSTNMRYLRMLCDIVCFDYSLLSSTTLISLQNELETIESSYYKGMLTEEVIRNILKSRIRHLKYTGKIPHCADFMSLLYLIEIKNHKKKESNEILKFCFDMIYQYRKTKKYRFGLFIHLFKNKDYYIIDEKTGKITNSNSFDKFPYVPFLGIPFVELYKIDEILCKISSYLDNFTWKSRYGQIFFLAKKYNTKDKLQAENARLKAENTRLKKLLTLNNIPF